MPTLRYNPVPSVEPTTSSPGGFQQIQASPSAFGAERGAALSTLGQQFERAGDVLANAAVTRQNLLNQVTADDYSNKALDAANKILYGDPDKPGDVGFYGLKGEHAMREFPNARKNLDRVLQEHRASLQNPVQQHLFDRDVRRSRLILTAEMGRHYDRENNRYTESVYKGQIGLSEREASRAIANGDYERADAEIEKAISAAVKLGVFTGKSKEETDVEIAKITANAVETRAERLMAENPLAAKKFLENNRDKLPAERVLALEGRIEAKAVEQEAKDIAAGRPSKASPLVRGGAVEKRIEQAAEENNLDPKMAKVVASIESNFGQAKDRAGSQFQGVFQLGDAAAARVGGREVEHGVRFLALTKKDLADKIGREPKDWEVYLAHQQGASGAATLLANPGVPAGKLLPASHISQNGGDPNAPASAFVKLWQNKYASHEARIGNVPSTKASEAAVSSEATVNVVGGDGTNYVLTPAQSDQYYTLPAAQQETFLQGLTKSKDVILPALDPGEVPDTEVPGLTGQIQRVLKDPRAVKDGELTRAGERAIKDLRTQANAAFAAQQHQVRLQKQAENAKDEQISQQMLKRMKPDSPNYPTLGEILESELSPSKKMTMVGFFERQTRPDPASKISARNQIEVFRRMQPDYDGEDKITSEKQINDGYLKGDYTDSAREKLIKDFREIQTASAPEWEKRKRELLKHVAPKIVPAVIGLGMTDGLNADPAGAERVTNWQDAVADKIQEYKTAGKNPALLFQPGTPDKPNPEYVGGGAFLKQFQPNLKEQINRDVPAPSTQRLPAPPGWRAAAERVAKMTTKEELAQIAKDFPLLRDAAIARALELGLVKPDTAPPVQ